MLGLFLVIKNLPAGLCLYCQTAKQPDTAFTSLKPQITCWLCNACLFGNVRHSDICDSRLNKSQNIWLHGQKMWHSHIRIVQLFLCTSVNMFGLILYKRFVQTKQSLV